MRKKIIKKFWDMEIMGNRRKNRLLYKFEDNQKKFGCVGSCGYVPASVKCSPQDRTEECSESHLVCSVQA